MTDETTTAESPATTDAAQAVVDKAHEAQGVSVPEYGLVAHVTIVKEISTGDLLVKYHDGRAAYRTKDPKEAAAAGTIFLNEIAEKTA